MVLLDSVMSLYNSDKLLWLSNDFAAFFTFRDLQRFIHGDENFNLGSGESCSMATLFTGILFQ